MSIESVRGCGFRKVGACYLVGDYPYHEACDRMPFPLTVCPVCSQGIKVGRAYTAIKPRQLWGTHQECNDSFHPCFICDPEAFPEVAFIMLVGERHYPNCEDFLHEANEMGVSKRIPFMPKSLELGKTVIFLAHPKAAKVKESAVLQQAMGILEESKSNQPRLLEAEREEMKLGIFAAFIPKKVEKLVWESEYTEESIERHKKRGIELVPVPAGDKDHA